MPEEMIITPSEPPPKLWNPGAAAAWCLLLPLPFSVYLHARNAQELGRTGEAKANFLWFYGVLAYMVLAALSHPWLRFPNLYTLGINLLLILVWYLSLGRRQVNFVQENFGNDYQHKRWLKPMLITLGSIVLFLAANVAVAIVHRAFPGPPQAQDPSNLVIWQGTIRRVPGSPQPKIEETNQIPYITKEMDPGFFYAAIISSKDHSNFHCRVIDHFPVPLYVTYPDGHRQLLSEIDSGEQISQHGKYISYDNLEKGDPSGTYTKEIEINGQPFRTVTFYVQPPAGK